MKSDLPNSSQFSPTQTPLPRLLEIVTAHEPDRQAVSLAILNEFFPGRAERTEDWKLANNTVIAMAEYGLFDKPLGATHVALTELGRSLAEKAEQGDHDGLYADFARHILLNRRGLDVVAAIEDLAARGQTLTKATIVKELAQRGIYHPPNGTHLNGMRQWFEAAGLVAPGEWAPNRDRLKALLGVGMEDVEAFAGLTTEQRAFAKAFARLNTDQELSNKVAQYASTLYGVEFPEGGLPQSVLFALRDVGLIECEKTTGGRGAKPYIVRPTEKLRAEIIEPLLTAIEQSAGAQYRHLIRMRYQDILVGLKSASTHEKGIALEALAFYLGRLLGLEFVEWRLRTAKTGGAELDVIMESARLIFSRWQVQCKNATEASLEDIAKEVGLAQVIKSNVILIVTTGRVGSAARRFSEQVMRDTNLYVALVTGADLAHLQDTPADIAAIMNRQAQGAMTIKKGQRALL